MRKLTWIAVILLCSCNLIRKSQDANHLRKAQDQFKLHPESFAELSAKYYPSKDTSYVIDSVSYDTLYLQPEPITTIEYRSDTVFKTIATPGTTRFITKTITKDSVIIKDGGPKEAALIEQIAQKDKTVADATAQYASLQSSAKWWKTAGLITWSILAALIIGWIVAKIYKK